MRRLSVVLAVIAGSVTPVPAHASTCVTGVVAVAAGDSHSAAVRVDGTVLTWGSNFDGELGNGTTTFDDGPAPAPVGGFTGAVDVAAGSLYTLVLKADGTVWGWGRNRGRLGDGTWTLNRLTPVQAIGITNAVAVAAGWQTSFAVGADGTLWAWGGNPAGALGVGTFDAHATPVPALVDRVVAVAAGMFHTVALRDDGTVWAWGDNYAGQLGQGDRATRTRPTRVPGLNDVVAVAAGAAHSVALTAEGVLYAWGSNAASQSGGPRPARGNETDFLVPVRVPLLTTRTFATARVADAVSFALDAAGRYTVWGADDAGQAGNGPSEAGLVPSEVSGPLLTGELDGTRHVLAVARDGSLWSWGRNWSGQLGDGTSTDRNTPVPVGCS